MSPLVLAAAVALSLSPVPSAPRTDLDARLNAPVHDASACSTRLGPFATQDRAWAVWRMARDEAARRGAGYGVSNGVFICYLPSRAYCFNVFHPC